MKIKMYLLITFAKLVLFFLIVCCVSSLLHFDRTIIWYNNISDHTYIYNLTSFFS